MGGNKNLVTMRARDVLGAVGRIGERLGALVTAVGPPLRDVVRVYALVRLQVLAARVGLHDAFLLADLQTNEALRVFTLYTFMALRIFTLFTFVVLW